MKKIDSKRRGRNSYYRFTDKSWDYVEINAWDDDEDECSYRYWE